MRALIKNTLVYVGSTTMFQEALRFVGVTICLWCVILGFWAISP